MARQPERRPGEANPRPDADAPMRVVRAGESHQAHGLLGGSDGFGIARGVIAFLDWRKERLSRKNRTRNAG